MDLSIDGDIVTVALRPSLGDAHGEVGALPVPAPAPFPVPAPKLGMDPLSALEAAAAWPVLPKLS